jgi:hypothetical protein
VVGMVPRAMLRLIQVGSITFGSAISEQKLNFINIYSIEPGGSDNQDSDFIISGLFSKPVT